MGYVIVWIGVFGLLALWTLGVWLLNGLGVWTLSHADSVASGVGAVQTDVMPGWLAAFVPAELMQAMQSLLQSSLPMLEGLLGWAGPLASGLTVAMWMLWGAGAFLLVLAGIAVHVVLRLASGRAGQAVGALKSVRAALP